MAGNADIRGKITLIWAELTGVQPTFFKEKVDSTQKLVNSEVNKVLDRLVEDLPEPKSLGAQAYCRSTLKAIDAERKRYE
jgi:hypothetical protein